VARHRIVEKVNVAEKGDTVPALKQIGFATIALAIGSAVYLFDRQPETVYFISTATSLPDGSSVVFGAIGNYLPTFVHVYAFILLTAALLAPGGAHAGFVCVFWALVDSVFELAQIDSVAARIAGIVPEWFAGIPLLENIPHYFLAGTFDVLDLVSIFAGTIAAYLTIVMSTERSWRHASAIESQ
jgi:hypothetical protein